MRSNTEIEKLAKIVRQALLEYEWLKVIEQAIKEAGLDKLVYGNCVKCGQEDILHPTEKLCRYCFSARRSISNEVSSLQG